MKSGFMVFFFLIFFCKFWHSKFESIFGFKPFSFFVVIKINTYTHFTFIRKNNTHTHQHKKKLQGLKEGPLIQLQANEMALEILKGTKIEKFCFYQNWKFFQIFISKTFFYFICSKHLNTIQQKNYRKTIPKPNKTPRLSKPPPTSKPTPRRWRVRWQCQSVRLIEFF